MALPLIDYNHWESVQPADGLPRKKFWHELSADARLFLADRGWSRTEYDLRVVDILKGKPQPRGFSEGMGGGAGRSEYDASPSDENRIRCLEDCR